MRPPRRAKQAHYPISFRLEAVRRVEASEIQRVLAAELGVARIILIEWLRRYGTAAYARMKRKMFTPAQKHAIARELRAGRLSEDEALLKYGIGEKKALRVWVAARQAAEAAAVAAAPDPPASPTPAGSELAAELRRAQWQIEALHTLIDQAEAAYKIDIRKKGGAKPSKWCARSTRTWG